jgi:hypothetical protein
MNQGPRGDCLMKKNRLSKISWHCPFNLKLLVFSSIIVFKIGENSWTLMFIFFLETFYLCNWISPRYYRPMPIQTVYSVFNNRNSKDLKNFPIKQNFKILVGWGCESRKLLYHSIRNKFESNNYSKNNIIIYPFTFCQNFVILILKCKLFLLPNLFERTKDQYDILWNFI